MESLPLELVDVIGKFLTITEQNRLRLTCWTYYQLFRDGLDHVMTPTQRNHYYKLLFCFQHHHVAIDNSPNELEKLTVALILCRLLDLSFTCILSPSDDFPTHMSCIQLAQHYGVRDPIITSPESLRTTIYSAQYHWGNVISDNWKNRLKLGTLIVVSSKHNPDDVRQLVDNLSSDLAQNKHYFTRSRIIYYPRESIPLIEWRKPPGLTPMLQHIIEQLIIVGVVPAYCNTRRDAWAHIDTWCHEHLSPVQISELETIKQSLYDKGTLDPTFKGTVKLMKPDAYYDPYIMTIAPTFVLKRLVSR
jgi:hypothetical protein